MDCNNLWSGAACMHLIINAYDIIQYPISGKIIVYEVSVAII